jgi:hypothetical protein
MIARLLLAFYVVCFLGTIWLFASALAEVVS